MTTTEQALRLADAIAEHLARPDHAPARFRNTPWWRQSLAHGMPGIALLHIERAAAGRGSWRRAEDWLAAAAHGALTAGAHSHPCYGTLALAHPLLCAREHRPGDYHGAMATLDRRIRIDVQHHLSQAHARLDADAPPVLKDFDALQGLTGYGAYLLRRDPDGELIRAVLSYLVRLTQPRLEDGTQLPGWWVHHAPSGRPDPRFPHGHANNGLAHGITGPLALLALATRRGISVLGQTAAISTICAWLDRWKIGQVWPYWITREQLHTGRCRLTHPARPSWCYGAAGVARAQQLAGLALADPQRRSAAEEALLHALTDPRQLAATTDPSLCHGHAGLAHLAARTALNAPAPTAEALRCLTPQLLAPILSHDAPRQAAHRLVTSESTGPGLLDGAAGIALAIYGAATPPITGWDGCLIIS